LFWLESSQAQENSCINLMTRASWDFAATQESF
jgi:hypothetical protein